MAGASGSITLPAVFSNHMVLQRECPLQVWGHATGSGDVQVAIVDPDDAIVSTAKGVVGSDGLFRVTLPPLTASKLPHRLVVTVGSEITERTDLLIGDVWLCGGQSNMEWPVSASADAQPISDSLPPTVRFFTVPHELAAYPVGDVVGEWVVASPASTPKCTAVGAWFAQDLSRALDIPIGLLNINWGGSPAEAWVPVDTAAESPAFRDVVATERAAGAAYEQESLAEKQRKYDLQFAQYIEAVESYWKSLRERELGFVEGWLTAPASEENGWAQASLPQVFGSAPETVALADFDGATWWRRGVEVPASWAGKAARISLGAIDDSDACFVNGVEIGRTTQLHMAPRVYDVPAGLLKAGGNEITLFIIDTGGSGGLSIRPQQMLMRVVDGQGVPQAESKSIALAGSWRWKRGGEFDGRMGPQPPAGAAHPQAAWGAFGSMWNGMMSGVAPYGIRGAIWYQGESNADRAQSYRALLPLLIESWRNKWGVGKFPFGIVQLAAFRAPSDDPVEGEWARLRQAQLDTAKSVEVCGLVVTTDVGDANDIHPRNKRAVGERLAGWALSTHYGKGGEWSGPLYRGYAVAGSVITLAFDHAQGLAAQGGGKLDGFAIAGADGRFRWADARIEGDRVIVSHVDVSAPVAVRYAWSSNPVRANLTNATGLPASPFATD